MPEIDYAAERRKLMDELGHHHVRPMFIGLDAPDTDHPSWRVGGDHNDGCPRRWAGLPVVYVEAPDLPRGATRAWLRRDNPLVRRDV